MPPAGFDDPLEGQHPRPVVVRSEVAVDDDGIGREIRRPIVLSNHHRYRSEPVTARDLKASEKIIVAAQPLAKAVYFDECAAADEARLHHGKLVWVLYSDRIGEHVRR